MFIYLNPLLSVIIVQFILLLFKKFAKFLAGITCPPVPPVINKFFFHNSSFFLFVKDNKKPNKNATEIMEDPPLSLQMVRSFLL